MGIWKIWKNRDAIADVIKSGVALLKAADKDGDDDIDTDDLKRWLEDEEVGIAVLKVVISIFKLVSVFR